MMVRIYRISHVAITSEKHQASGIRHQASGIRHQKKQAWKFPKEKKRNKKSNRLIIHVGAGGWSDWRLGMKKRKAKQ
jgi:hypothetical protein